MLASLRFHLSPVSKNTKTGPIPVSTSSKKTCAPSCPFFDSGCYGDNYGLNMHWAAVTRGERGVSFPHFMAAIDSLPDGQLWRHNQAGDLPHTNGRISRRFVKGLISANRGIYQRPGRKPKRGFTYTHHDLSKGENLSLIRHANRQGFTINVSCETEAKADSAILAGLPAVIAVPSTESRTAWHTKGGNVVTVCPAQRSDTKTCANCELCQKRPPNLVIAFIAHGTSKAKADAAIQAAQ